MNKIKIELNTIYNIDCLEGMKLIPDKSIDCIICDYLSGMSLREVAKKYNTNHHRIKRILNKNGIQIRKPEPKHLRGVKKYGNDTIRRYANMKSHLRYDVDLEWLCQFVDFEKLRFLNKQVINKDGTRFCESREWYISFIEKFYYDEQFNKLYQNYLTSGKNKYKKPSLDHILPRSKGGTNELSNLRFITYLENMCKRDMTLEEWEYIKENIGEYFI